MFVGKMIGIYGQYAMPVMVFIFVVLILMDYAALHFFLSTYSKSTYQSLNLHVNHGIEKDPSNEDSSADVDNGMPAFELSPMWKV